MPYARQLDLQRTNKTEKQLMDDYIYINCVHNMFAHFLSYTVHNMVQQFLKKLSSWVGMSKTLNPGTLPSLKLTAGKRPLKIGGYLLESRRF